MDIEKKELSYDNGEILKFAQACRFEQEHALHVAGLSLQLFDQLGALHHMGIQERQWLECAAVLHDIGWSGGQQGHHKRSRDMIIAAKNLPFDENTRQIIGLIARYHRKSLPQADHQYYRDLSPDQKHLVNILSSILRLADGLDRSHASLVSRIDCRVFPSKVLIVIQSRIEPKEELLIAKKKADLFEAVFARDVALSWAG